MKLTESLVQMVSEACAVLDQEGNVLYSNSAFQELIAASAPIVGVNFHEVLKSVGVGEHIDVAGLARSSEPDANTRNIQLHVAGRLIQVQLIVQEIEDTPEVVRFLVSIKRQLTIAPDHSAPSLAGEARAGKAWYNSGENLFGGKAGVYTWDLVTGELTVPASLLHALGYERHEIGDPVAFFTSSYHPEDLAKFDRVLQSSMQNKTPYRTTIRLRASDGRYHHFLLRGQPICDEGGNVIMMVGTEADITEQVDLNIKLLRAEKIAKLGSWTHNLHSDEMHWSPEMHYIVGHEGGDYTAAMSLNDISFHPDDISLAHELNARLLLRWKLDPNAVERTRVRIFHPGGKMHHCEISATIQVDAEGKPFESVGTLQDITSLVEAEERLLSAQKMEVIGKLAGGAAHDFNNLLAVIMGNLELVEDTSDPEQIAGYVKNAIKAASQGANLTRNLLSFARKAVLNPARLNLNSATANMRSMLERVIPESIRIEIKAGDKLWSVHADKSAFTNAILNLAINARDAMPNGGVITIETENKVLTEAYIEARQETLMPGPYVVLSLSDNGAGIQPDLLSEVFTPYFTTKPLDKGSGLGLSMVHGFLRQSGGAVRLYSEVGVGTTVKLFFPAMALDASLEIEQQSNAPERSFNGRVLLAEDNEAVRSVLAKRLGTLGLECTTAVDGDAAIREYENSGPYDLLVTDVVMPGRYQGPDLARELRKRQDDLKVIFITGYPNEATIHGNGLRKEDIRLMKPISKVDLVRAVDQLLVPARSL